MAAYGRKRHRIPNVVSSKYIEYMCAARGSARMILEAFCMQLDTYALCMYRRYRSFLSCSHLFASVDVHKSVWEKEGDGEKQKAATVNRCIRSDSARLWRAHPTVAGIFLTTHATNYPHSFFRLRNAPPFWRFRVGTDKRDDDSLDDEQNWNIANRTRVRARIIINATTFIVAAERIIESLSAAATGPSAFHPNCNEKKVISHSEARITSRQEIVRCI